MGVGGRIRRVVMMMMIVIGIRGVIGGNIMGVCVFLTGALLYIARVHEDVID